MARDLCLIRHCLGIVTRIECEVRPLADGRGLWTLLCAAGMNAAQPSTIKAQGPFHGPLQAEGVLAAIATNLVDQGYRECPGPAIWRLHLQAELRRQQAEHGRHLGDCQFRPET